MEIRFVFASASLTGFISFFFDVFDVRLMDPAIIVFLISSVLGLDGVVRPSVSFLMTLRKSMANYTDSCVELMSELSTISLA